MKKTTLIIIIFLFTLALPAIAGGQKTITLKNGSIISGHIIGIDNGSYVITSPDIGEIRVKEDSVISIIAPGETAQPMTSPHYTYGNQTTNNAQTSTYANQMQTMQSQILSNPALMADIQSLAQDPEVIAALNDPTFAQAVQSGNVQAVQASPQLQRLLDSPKMQAFIQKVHAQKQ